ncbi:T-cell surface glycoprotein CD3 delta chain [Tupaia chinensis]|uniref:T-cell surface glycoprotein CD3 delta chain n=1 Tax=Tupaia chinensis TaxID=246437 RepID=L9KSU1_TUPCH|nr:T-cell surface glycoprotein CD3 delta chain [Tupaia chinensis]
MAIDHKGCVTIAIHAKPGSKQNAVTDLTTKAVNVAITAPPAGEASAELCRFLSKVLELRKKDVALDKGVSPFNIIVEELEDKVLVNCNTSITQLEGTMGTFFSDDKQQLDLGRYILDPRGVYQCRGTGNFAKKVSTLQIYYRTADTQILLRNDQLYQTLGDRDDAQYSHLGGNWSRNK